MKNDDFTLKTPTDFTAAANPLAEAPTKAQAVRFAMTDEPRGESDESKAAKAEYLGRTYFDLLQKAQQGIDPNKDDHMLRAEAVYFTKALTGQDDVYGKLWQKGGFKTGREYLERMHSFFLHGGEKNLSPELKAFREKSHEEQVAEAMEKRGTLDKIVHSVGSGASYALDWLHRADTEKLADEKGLQEDIYKEQIRSAYAAKLMADNAWYELSAIMPTLSKDAQTCAKALLESKDNRLPETMWAKFNNLDDSEKALICRVRTCLAPRVEGGFLNTIGDMAIGTANVAANVAAAPYRFGNKIGMMISNDAFDAGFDINELARRRQYLWQATGRPSAGGDLESGYLPQMQFEQMCQEHGFLAESLIGAISTLPYMAAASAPGIGVATVAMEAMSEMDDNVAMAGGDITDPDYMMSNLLFGALYAYTERLQVEGLLGGVKDIEIRQALLKGFWNGVKDTKTIRTITAGTLAESLQEGLQNGIMEANEALALKEDATRAFAEGFTRDFINSLGTMLMVEGGSLGFTHWKRSGFNNPFTASGTAAGREARSLDLETEYEKSMSLDRMVEFSARSEQLRDIMNAIEAHRLYETWQSGGKEALLKAGIDPVRAEEWDYFFSSTRNGVIQDEETGEDMPDLRWQKAQQDIYRYLAHEAAERTKKGEEADLAAFDLAMENLDWVRSAWSQGAGIHRTDEEGKVQDPGAKALEGLGFSKDVAKRLSEYFHRERSAAYSPAALNGIKASYEARMEGRVTAKAALAQQFGGRIVRLDGADYLRFDGADGPSLVRIDETPGGIDFGEASEGVAVDVERATQGEVTKQDWMDATAAERRAIWKRYGLVHEGAFKPSAAVKVSLPADPSVGVDSVQAAKVIGAITLDSQTDNRTIADTSAAFHEVFHAFSQFAETSGLWTKEDIAFLEKKFGKAKMSGERFDEEAGAEGFRSFLARRANGALTVEDERSPFARIYAVAAGLDARAKEMSAQEAVADEAEKAFFHQLIAEANKPKPTPPAPKPNLPGTAAPQKGLKPSSTEAAEGKPGTETAETGTGNGESGAPKAETGTKFVQMEVPTTWSAYTPTGNVKVSGHWAVLDLKDVIHSNNPLYAVHMRAQLRNRKDNKAEEDTRKDIVNNFQGERLLDAPDTANGAPIVFYDDDGTGVKRAFVLSGNGRVLVLNELAERHLYDRYRNVMKAWAEARGMFVPTGETPILVRVIDDYGGATRDKVADLSNTNAIQQYTEEEQARADAEVIKALGLARLYQANADGTPDMTPGANDEFFSEFVRGVGDTSLYNSDRSLTQTARDRAQRALLAIAVGQGDRGRDVVKKLVEQTETLNIQRQKNAAAIMAAPVAALESNAAYAIGPDVSRAMADFMDYAEKRKAGKVGTFGDYFNQMDLIDGPSKIAREILRLLGSDKAAATIAEYVKAYCRAAGMEDAGGNLFGAARTREEIWADAARFVDDTIAKMQGVEPPAAQKPVESAATVETGKNTPNAENGSKAPSRASGETREVASIDNMNPLLKGASVALAENAGNPEDPGHRIKSASEEELLASQKEIVDALNNPNPQAYYDFIDKMNNHACRVIEMQKFKDEWKRLHPDVDLENTPRALETHRRALEVDVKNAEEGLANHPNSNHFKTELEDAKKKLAEFISAHPDLASQIGTSEKSGTSSAETPEAKTQPKRQQTRDTAIPKGEVRVGPATPEPARQARPPAGTVTYTINPRKVGPITSTMPAGAFADLRGPYDTKNEAAPESKNPVRSIFTGRVTKQLDPQGRYWGDKMPLFMGYKKEMFDRTVMTLRQKLGERELAKFDTLVDYFGGGGSWGTALALAAMPNVKRIIVNEFDPGRAKKIELLQTMGESIAAKAEKLFRENGVYKEMFAKLMTAGEDGGESGSGGTMANVIIKNFKRRFEKDPEQLGLMYAVTDCASRQLTGTREVTDPETGKKTEVKVTAAERWAEVMERLARDGKNATEMRKLIEERGGTVEYVNGDSTKPDFGVGFEIPHGGNVMAVADPPYYRTEGYSDDGSSWKVGLEKTPGAYAYADTGEFLKSLVDNGDGIVYTDEAWWLKKEYMETHRVQSDGLLDDAEILAAQPEFRRENQILQGIRDIIDHFDVAGKVADRYETLGVHHGKETKNGTETERRAAERQGSGILHGGAVGGGDDDTGRQGDGRQSVRRLAGGAEGEDDALLRTGGEGRQGSGLRREDAVRRIDAAIKDALPPDMAGYPGQAEEIERLARHSVRQVREDRIRDYAEYMSANAKRWIANAARRLDERMKAAGYTERVWHGTEGDDFNVFQFTSGNHKVPAAYFTYSRGTAQNYAALRAMEYDDEAGANTRQFYVNPGKVLDIDETENPLSFQEFVAMLGKAYEDGYNAVRVKGALDDQGIRLDENDENPEFTKEGDDDLPTDILIVMQQPGDNAPARIKAADPVTFADDELPIPLEMRADQSVADVRYSIGRAAPMTAVEVARAVEYFGTTDDPKEAAYILPDGRWLDYEQMGEHWEISQAFNKNHMKQLDALLEFDGDAAPYIDAALNAGLVRVTSGRFDLQGRPTETGLQMGVAPDTATARNMMDFVDAAAERYPTLRTFTIESYAAPGFTRQYDMADPRALAQIKRDINTLVDSRHSVSIVKPWPKDFPNATLMTTRTALMAKHEDLFRKAKAGDGNAAMELIDALMSDKKRRDKVLQLKKDFPDVAVAAAVHAEEETGRNALPRMFAKYIADTLGIKADDTIVQSVRAGHTGKDAWYRLTHRAQFDGEVEAGKEYILVDDHITQGGTINELRSYIENEGGKVVAVVALTSSKGSSILSPRKETIDELKQRYPDIDQLLRDADIAGSVDAITNSEAEYIKTFSPDTFRNRVAEAKRERVAEDGGGPLAEGVAGRETQVEREKMRHSVFMGIKGAIYDKPILNRLYEATAMARKVAPGNTLSGNTGKRRKWYTDEVRDEIYAKTGWWLGIDGQWRVEVSDLKPKTRFGKTNGTLVNGLLHTLTDSYRCMLPDICRHPTLFKAYPMLKDVIVRIVNPDKVNYGAEYNPNLNRISLTWDAVQWHNDEPSNVLNKEGLQDLSHELQHAIQDYEGFAQGGNKTVNGRVNYRRLAGEVEARNAAFRHGMPDDRAKKPEPWKTEDVPTIKQIITYGFAMTDIRGNPVKRHSIATSAEVEGEARRAIRAYTEDGGNKAANDALENYVAYFKLAHGSIPKPKTLARIGLSLGMNVVDPKRILKNAEKLAEQMKGSVVERASQNGDVATAMAMMKREKDISKNVENLIAGGAEMGGRLTHKGVGRINSLLQRRVDSMMRSFTAATLADMEGDTGIDIAAEILENNPDAFDTEYRKAKKAIADEAETADEGGEGGAATYAPYVESEMSDADRYKHDILLREAAERVARFIEAAKARAEENGAKAAEARERKRIVEVGGGDEGDGAGGAEMPPASAKWDITPKGVKANFKTPEEFAAFLRVWARDKFAKTHGLTTLGQVEQDRLFAEFYRICVRQELQDLADKLLAPKMMNDKGEMVTNQRLAKLGNGARVWVSRRIADIEKGMRPDSIERESADIFAFINKAAIRVSRVDLITQFRQELKSRYLEGPRFEELKLNSERKLTGWLEESTRYIMRVCSLSRKSVNGDPSELEREYSELHNIIDERARVYDESGHDVADAAKEDAETRKAQWKLALLDKYGAMQSLMPGEILDLQNQAYDYLENEALKLEQSWQETREEQNRVRGDLSAAIVGPNGQRYQDKNIFTGRLFDALNGMIRLRLEHLTRFAGVDKREKAKDAINAMMVMLGDGEVL